MPETGKRAPAAAGSPPPASGTAASRPAAPAGGNRPAWLDSPWAALIPGVVTLAIALYRLGTPSFTRDESATLLAVHRSFGQLVRMLGTVDVVHGAYYALIWVVTQVAGSGPVAVRLPSAVAVAVAGTMIALIGQRLASGRAGLASGLVWAVLPPVSFYAEDAREYAIVAALATVASYLLIRLAEPGGARVPWLAGYAVSVAFLGLTNVFGLLLLPAHALTLALAARRAGTLDRRRWAGWLLAAAAGVLAASPVALAGLGQLTQVGWIKRPGLSAVTGLTGLAGGNTLLFVLLAVTAVALLIRLPGGSPQLRAGWPPGMLALAVPWLVVPPLLLLVLSEAHPVYVFRYIVFCMPALALLAGLALAGLGWAGAAAALALLVVLSYPSQVAQRGQTGHGYAIGRIDQIVARHAQPGDALLNIRFLPLNRSAGMERQLEAGYPYGLARLRDLSAGESPERSATLGGTFAPAPVLRQRLAGVSRLWVVSWAPQPPQDLTGFSREREWRTHNVWLWLYQRGGSGA